MERFAANGFETWPLHDAALRNVFVDWARRTSVLSLSAFLTKGEQAVPCALVCTGLRSISLPHLAPWGESRFILSQSRSPDDELLIEMQSGDTLAIAAEGVALFPEPLVHISDTFLIKSRGLIVVPGPYLADLRPGSEFIVRLHRPDKVILETVARLEVEFSVPSPPGSQRRFACILPGCEKFDVPIGSELWLTHPAEASSSGSAVPTPTTVAELLDSLRDVDQQLAEQGYEPFTWHPPADDAVMASDDGAAQFVPLDYREFMSLTGRICAMEVHNGYDLFGASEALSRPDPVDGPPAYIRDITGRTRLVAIGADGGGNLFLLELSGTGRVFKWNHERSSDERTVGPTHPSIALAGVSFSAFLARVVEDCEHFLAGDRAWPYLAG